MSDNLMDRVQTLFLEALAQPDGTRDSWVRQQCGEDHDLLREVLSLLAHDTSQDSPLEAGIPADAFGAVAPGIAQFAVRICCPHCEQPIEVVDDDEIKEVVCSSCGSQIPLIDVAETRSYHRAETGQIAHFHLKERIGIGGFGSVYRAVDTKLDRTVAVKRPRETQLNAAEMEQFLREARAAAQLRHPHIVQVHEVGIESGGPYIVSEFIDGLTLADWLTGTTMTSRDSATLCITLAEAVHHAHEQGVVHRDLKPSNIMLDRSGRAFVMDFGLAKRDAGEISVTLEGQFLGTPAYTSPEQAKGDSHQADRRSDVYSLGVILYEMLAGERPFRGNTPMLLHQVRSVDARSPRELNSAIPVDLESICLKCLEKDPKQRYATAWELAEDLRRYVDGKPTLARPITRFTRGVRWCRRNPVVASLIGLVAASLVAGATVSLWQANEARRERNGAIKLAGEKAKLAAEKTELAAEKTELATAAGKSQRQAELQTALTQAGKADLSLETGRPDLALHALVDSLGTLPSGETEKETALRLRIAHEFTRIHHLRHAFPTEGTLKHLQFSPSGKLVVAVSHVPTSRRQADAKIYVWDAATGETVGQRSVSVHRSKSQTLTSYSEPLQADVLGITAADGALMLHRLDTLEVIQRWEHPEAVRALAFSSDGAECVTACEDVNRLWSVQSGELLQQFEHASRDVYLLPKDTLITATGKQVRIWDANSGRQRGADLECGEVLDISPSGDRMLTKITQRVPNRESRVFQRLWNLEDGTPIGEDRPYYTGAGEDFEKYFSPNGERFFCIYHDLKNYGAYEYWIVESKTGETIRYFKRPRALTRMVFSPNNALIAMGTLWGFATLQGTAWGEPKGPALEHNSQISHLEFPADSRHLLTSSDDGESILWETVDGQQVGQPIRQGPTSAQWSRQYVSLDSRGRRLLAPGSDGHVLVWELSAGAYPTRAQKDAERKPPAGFSATPDGNVWIKRDGTEFRDADTGELLMPPLQVSEQQLATAVTSDVKFLLLKRSILADPIKAPPFVVINLRTGEPARQLPDGLTWLNMKGQPDTRIRGARFLEKGFHAAGVWDLRKGPTDCIAWHPPAKGELKPPFMKSATFVSDDIIMTRSVGSLRLWKIDTGAPWGQVMQHPPVDPAKSEPPRILSVLEIVAGERIMTKGADHTLRFWNQRTGAAVGQVIQHPVDAETGQRTQILDVDKVADGKCILTKGADHTLRLWDAQTGAAVGSVMRHPAEFHVKVVDEERGRILVACEDNSAYVWDLHTGAPIAGPMQHAAKIQRAFFTPGGDMILTTSGDSTAQLWDAQTGARVGQAMQHADKISQAIFSPKGDMILTTSDRTVQLWDAKSGEPVGSPMQHREPPKAQFSDDGKLITSLIQGPRFPYIELWHAEAQMRIMPMQRYYGPPRLPEPVDAEPHQLRRRAEVITGLRRDGTFLTIDQWQQRKASLKTSDEHGQQ